MKEGYRALLGLVAAAAMLPACGGSQNATTAVPVSLTPQSKTHVLARTDRDLLYISNDYTNEVEVFTYPEGGHVAKLKGIEQPGPICTDSSGDVFITGYNPGKIIEYAHGATHPKATLVLPYPGFADDCAIDPTTNNLAATDGGELEIYQSISGSPITILPPRGSVFDWVSYDTSGNLFVSGAVGRNGAMWEVPKGMTTAFYITFPEGDQDLLLGPLHWDGEYISVLGLDTYTVSRVTATVENLASFAASIKGSVVSETAFENCKQPWTFWIQTSTLMLSCTARQIGTDKRYSVGSWDYPEGGKLTKSLIKGDKPGGPYRGIAVSIAP